MGPILLSTILCTLVSAGCKKATELVAPSTPRAISGRCDLTISPATGPAPTPPLIRQTDSGTCNLTRLGRVAFTGGLEINPVAGTQVGERTLTVANGDVLRMTSAGTSALSAPGVVSFVATITFVGGTGQFANATGQARAEGSANMMTSKTTMQMDGLITYSGPR